MVGKRRAQAQAPSLREACVVRVGVEAALGPGDRVRRAGRSYQVKAVQSLGRDGQYLHLTVPIV